MQALVTGGAGFIGCNLVAALARAGHTVTIADNLSRPGSLDNLRRLLDDPDTAPRTAFRPVDIRDSGALAGLMAEKAFDTVVHLAGQTAVTSSLVDPGYDFDINARGTFNVLEAVRRHASRAKVVFTSTNKVYGRLDHIAVEKTATRYVLRDYPFGIPEDCPLEPVNPYGCSKLAADSYVRDYAKAFGLRTTVLRMSCIYGDGQNGTTDQGWLNWFARAALRNVPITVYGDGLQTRDILHVEDLVEVLVGVMDSDRGDGETFNVGGGPEFTLSVWAEFGPLLAQSLGRSVPVRYASGRIGDQHVYVSDIRKISNLLSWKPRKAPADGINEMINWLRDQPTPTVG